jgi:pimeloyl-ACP methyl ester carboxylesterase
MRIATRTNLLLGVLGAAVSAAAIVHQSRKAEEDHPPRGRFIEVDGVRLHYIERGIGTPLVLLHGNGAMADDFAISGLIELAARRYRVVAFDRPGFGYSTRPRGRVWGPQAQAALVNRALAELGVAKAIVLGHSWGALVALAYAALYPKEVAGVVLMSGYYYPSLRLDVPLLSAPAIPILGDVLRYTVSPWLGRLLWPLMVKRLFGPGPISPKAQRFPVWMALRPSQLHAAAAESAMMIPGAIALAKHYDALEVPVHIVAGEADRYVSTRRHSAALHRRMRGSTLHVVPGVGHMVHHIAPEEVMAVIDEAAKDLQPRSVPSPAMDDAEKAVREMPAGSDLYEKLKE